MKERSMQHSRDGFSLLEIMVALAIFTVTLGVTAQGLAYAFGLVTLQSQRVTASNDCRAVIAAMRQVLTEDLDTTACPGTSAKFPCLLLDYVNTFPANAAAVAALSTTARMPFAGLYTLRGETITIALTSSTGGAVVKGTGPSTSTNPVCVKVTAQWTGPRGITYTEIVNTIITDV
jgi:prepilin-type N-terminal cleavage/methylation domain-containing protein